MKRLAVIAAAFFAAVLLGACVAAIGVVLGDQRFHRDRWEVVQFAFLVGGMLALPVAVPVIIFSELRKFGRWWLFTSAGVGAGLVLVFLMIPSLAIKPVAIALVATSSAAFFYWFIAWRLFPPRFDFVPPPEAQL